MSCQANNKRKGHKISIPAPVLGWHLCFCLLPASLLQKPPAWASFCSWFWIFFCTPPTDPRQCPGRHHTCQKSFLKIFSKQEPKVWCRDSIFGYEQPTVVQMNKIKAIWSWLGGETNSNSDISLIHERVRALLREAGSLPIKKFVNQHNGRRKKTQYLLLLPVWQGTWSHSSPDFHWFRLNSKITYLKYWAKWTPFLKLVHSLRT